VPAIPKSGRPWAEIERSLIAAKQQDFDWRKGRVPLYVYYDEPDVLDAAVKAYTLFFSENALGKKAFPSLDRLEREVVDMALALFRAGPAAGGSFTSGGTESLFLALKTARDRARAERPGLTRPNLVVPQTCHATVDKAAHYLGLDVRRVPVSPGFRADIAAMSAAIDDETIMLIGSAPGYTHGVFDPIPELGALALKHDLWLHVDACLGGFLAPFLRQIGYPVPAFDFTIPGVTSLSADLHKYGFAAKGASVLLFNAAADQRYQRFAFRDWPRGLYATETFLGTRPGGAVAAAWAVMNYLGEAGYQRIARKIMDTKEAMIAGITAIDGLAVVQPSELCILIYRSCDPLLDINAVAEGLAARGWFVGRSLEPVGIHLALNPVHAQCVEPYLADLGAVAGEVRGEGRVGKLDEHTY
jgi:sphinganine-1-phosphate aldolase